MNTQTKLQPSLEVSTNTKPTANGGKFAYTTDVTIRCVGYPIATRTIPGTWNCEKALVEFKRAPKLFNFVEGFGLKVARQYKLVPTT